LQDRFPSFNFVSGLEDLASQRAALGIGEDWIRSLYYDPIVSLLDPNGGMRLVLSHRSLRAPQAMGSRKFRIPPHPTCHCIPRHASKSQCMPAAPGSHQQI
jgi:hypothetical protein